jgi:hypothetical protein
VLLFIKCVCLMWFKLLLMRIAAAYAYCTACCTCVLKQIALALQCCMLVLHQHVAHSTAHTHRIYSACIHDVVIYYTLQAQKRWAKLRASVFQTSFCGSMRQGASRHSLHVRCTYYLLYHTLLTLQTSKTTVYGFLLTLC